MTVLNYVSGIIKSTFFAQGKMFYRGSEVEIYKIKKDGSIYLKIFDKLTYESVLTPFIGIDESTLLR